MSALTREEKYLARILFKNKIHECDNKAFEDLFTRLMTYYDSRFKPVKPQGRYGDRKNDGFIKETGQYFQVYGPEDLKFSERDAKNKLEEDFKGLIKFWDRDEFGVKSFSYVVNDKYKGSYPTLYTAVQDLEDKHKHIKIHLMRSSDLEDILMELEDDEICSIVGSIPNPEKISYDYSLMSEVINFLLEMPRSTNLVALPINPDFDEKIRFNGLSDIVASFLRAGQRSIYGIEEFFEYNSKFTKEELRKVLTEIYNEAIDDIPDSNTKNDEVFFYIVKRTVRDSTIAIDSCLYIIIAYYFEYCDIYEVPI